MSESGSQFVYGRGPGANSFIPVCSIDTNKSIVNVYYEGCEVSGDGRQRQIL
jgi:hypothetical protein